MYTVVQFRYGWNTVVEINLLLCTDIHCVLTRATTDGCKETTAKQGLLASVVGSDRPTN
jgi:hypothetical protein